jgi:hypothetical protein
VRRYVLSGTALLAVVGGVALLVLWLGGVFDGGDGRSGLSRTAYVAQLQRLCREANRKLARVPAPANPADPKALASSIDQALPILQGVIADERKLEPPAELEAQARRAFELSDPSVAALKETRRQAAAGDGPGALRALGRFEAARDRARAAGRALGLRC